MSKSDLKLLAQRAKNRLKYVGATQTNQKEPNKSIALASREYAIIATRVRIEDDPLFSKVSKLLTKNPDAYNPIGELINHSEFDNLSPTEKQRYILNLSKRFNKIKEKLAT